MEANEMNKVMHDFTEVKFVTKYADYHKSYDLLMPVWVKFRDLNLENMVYSKLRGDLIFSISCKPIKETHRLIYEAITWYNQLNK